MEKMGIKSNEMMAIGDSENDLPLFEMAGFSVAMGNARKEIQDRADAVTSPNYDDGVAAALERYVLQDP
jgi:hydroxymethylpyrimidine pyrophosphatase-like HAD family hydrolase